MTLVKGCCLALGVSALTQAAAAVDPTTPGGKKAGSAGGGAVPYWKDHIGWWYDWTPKPEDMGVVGVQMLWGSGNNGEQDAKRFQEFQQLTETPEYLLGFNEPDCEQPDVSANFGVDEGVRLWNEQIVPWGEKGSLLGSPSMCKQLDENWLNDFSKAELSRDWNFTAIHVYKPDMDGVQADIDHYWNAYNKPIWITEFACVDDNPEFKPCEDQGRINQWIRDVVDLFEKDDRVAAYAYINGGGLSDAWEPVNRDGSGLSESGQTYLDSISKYN